MLLLLPLLHGLLEQTHILLLIQLTLYCSRLLLLLLLLVPRV